MILHGKRCNVNRHPPTYYIPPKDVKVDLLKKNSKSSFCEFKGVASYYTFSPSASSSSSSSSSSSIPTITSRIWSYNAPTAGTHFAPIKGYFSFYADAGTGSASGRDDKGGWKCWVEEEIVKPQEGDVSTLAFSRLISISIPVTLAVAARYALPHRVFVCSTHY